MGGDEGEGPSNERRLRVIEISRYTEVASRRGGGGGVDLKGGYALFLASYIAWVVKEGSYLGREPLNS